jgi:hypothetical protein
VSLILICVRAEFLLDSQFQKNDFFSEINRSRSRRPAVYLVCMVNTSHLTCFFVRCFYFGRMICMNMQDANAYSFFPDLYELGFAFWHTFAHHRLYVQKLHSRIPLLARYLVVQILQDLLQPHPGISHQAKVIYSPCVLNHSDLNFNY